jgi:hypothetical protein
MNPFVGFLAGLVGRDLAKASARGVQSGADAILRPIASAAVKAGIGSGKRGAISRAFRKSPLLRPIGRLARATKVGRAIVGARRAQRVATAPAGPPPPDLIAQHMDYGSLMANMGNPNAHATAVANATQAASQSQAADKTQEAEEKKNEAVKEATESLKKLAAGGLGSVTALVGMAVATHKFVEAVTESRRKYAEINGMIGNAFANLDIKTLQLNMRTGRGIAGSTAKLTEATGEMREALQPLEQMVETIENLVATAGAKMVTGIVNGITGIAVALGIKEKLDQIEQNLRENGDNDETIAEKMMREIRQGAPWINLNIQRAPLRQVRRP